MLNWILHPIISYRVWRYTRNMQVVLADKMSDMQEEAMEMGEHNPYAPGTWDVEYIHSKDKTITNFRKLTPEEQEAEREARVDLPVIHAETVEEILEKCSHVSYKK